MIVKLCTAGDVAQLVVYIKNYKSAEMNVNDLLKHFPLLPSSQFPIKRDILSKFLTKIPDQDIATYVYISKTFFYTNLNY